MMKGLKYKSMCKVSNVGDGVVGLQEELCERIESLGYQNEPCKTRERKIGAGHGI